MRPFVSGAGPQNQERDAEWVATRLSVRVQTRAKAGSAKSEDPEEGVGVGAVAGTPQAFTLEPDSQ
jgi:hypothetical protein